MTDTASEPTPWAVAVVLLVVSVVLLTGTWLVLGRLAMRHDLEHERKLRHHVCNEMDKLGADADSGADVAACTFKAVR